MNWKLQATVYVSSRNAIDRARLRMSRFAEQMVIFEKMLLRLNIFLPLGRTYANKCELQKASCVAEANANHKAGSALKEDYKGNQGQSWALEFEITLDVEIVPPMVPRMKLFLSIELIWLGCIIGCMSSA